MNLDNSWLKLWFTTKTCFKSFQKQFFRISALFSQKHEYSWDFYKRECMRAFYVLDYSMVILCSQSKMWYMPKSSMQVIDNNQLFYAFHSFQ